MGSRNKKANHRYQAPKGTRDFDPDAMAVRRHIESAWQQASIDHGFDQVDGPTFEHLDLYTVKSGDEIVSELFSFKRAGGDVDYALRPEFTPTLARMIAARGAALPIPVKWFSIPTLFRAERPQRGRLREHVQWNVDVVGSGGPAFDAEVITTAIDGLARLGLTPEQVQVKVSHRQVVAALLSSLGVADTDIPQAFTLIDHRDRMPTEVFSEKAAAIGLTAPQLAQYEQVVSAAQAIGRGGQKLPEIEGLPSDALGAFEELRDELTARDADAWCHFDLGIVRGLAYYTGLVFEIHETSGAERAVAGGGRYDKLVELFGGPSMPACGFGMGDVVLGLVLEDNGLIEPVKLKPRPDLFLISDGSEIAETTLVSLAARLRREGLHVRHSYKATRNVGKLLGEAGKVGARKAAILGRELENGHVTVKDLDAGTQNEISLNDLASTL